MFSKEIGALKMRQAAVATTLAALDADPSATVEQYRALLDYACWVEAGAKALLKRKRALKAT